MLEIWGNPIPAHMQRSLCWRSEETPFQLTCKRPLCTIQWKRWLRDYQSITKLLWMLQAIWLDKEGHHRILHIIINIYSWHKVTCKWPTIRFPQISQPMTCDVSKRKQMRDLVLICLIVYIQLQISYHAHILKTRTNPPRSEGSISKEFKIYQR